MNRCYLREAVTFCSLGNTPDEITHGIRSNSIEKAKEFAFGAELVSRQYRGMKDKRVTGNDKFYAVLEQLLLELITKAHLDPDQMEECALLIGSTSMSIPCSEPIFKSNPDEVMLPYIGYGAIGERLAHTFGLGGEVALFATACTSSANALLYGQTGINTGKFQRAIVLGFDFYNELTMSGFESFGLLSRDGCRPFDAHRSGMVLGEGCGAILLDTVPSSYKSQLILRGGANRSDTFSPTAHNTDGIMVAQTIRDALCDAKVEPCDVGLIKAHATGSETNDRAEGTGLRHVFSQMPLVLALKSSLGHTLGGCGAVEFAVLWFCLREGFLPKTYGFEVMDDSIGIAPSQDESEVSEGILLLNHFGFGGSGVVLVAQFGECE
ncbi:MAG: beta-ketoacyl synthase N-terminal-like domain-containing protein [Sulfuricurvum sp.]|nr:beta-ketoacyl synthase N-terminal-like domain-containing protein [Sulfuricurvum sp.]